jgi:hypothetical protein
MSERPKYRLTDVQQQALAQLQYAASGQVSSSDEQEGVLRASSDFWVAMFDHDSKDNEYENTVLSGLAVLGIWGRRTHGCPPYFTRPRWRQ